MKNTNDNEEEEEEVFWLVSQENIEARRWLNKLDKLNRINIKHIIFTRVDEYWDGPLAGIAEYNGKEYYSVAIFDEEAPSLNINVGRCYLLLEINDRLKEKGFGDGEIYSYTGPDLDYSNPIGYFGGSLEYFMTHPDAIKKK
ncbi:MAG: hypothetical protein HWN67_14345 [Candidatus Helarchaeota archaeon]|nr:hypothetical protein [Candidatus Helarchaeota archaeon]